MAELKQKDRQALRDWNSYRENFISLVSTELNENESEAQQKARIKRLEADFEEWKIYYFPKYCYAPPAKFHKKASKRALANPEWYEVRMWARELSKDVVTMMETLYQTLTGVKKNILFISNSQDKAADLLKPFKLNLEFNDRIINDYGIQQLAGSWKDGDFTTTAGISFLAVGADQSPRGSREEEIRPDKIIISDIDTDQDVRNEEIIKKRWVWFEKAVFPTRSVSKDLQVMWLGNLIAKDCCIARAAKMADKVDQVDLEDKDGVSTWPEKNSQENIARIKAKISTSAYQGEYMNNPISEGTVFKKIRWGKVPPLHKLKFVVVYGDPAPSNSENKKNSFKAVFIIGRLDENYYIYTGYLEQVTNDTWAEWFYSCEKYVNGKTQIYNYIENNSLQDPFYQQVFKPIFISKGNERDHHLSISPDERKKPDKFTRIEGNLEPLNRDGRLIFNEAEKDNPHMIQLEDQFKMVTPQLSAPADGPDCIEGGHWIINNKSGNISEAIHIGQASRNNKRY